MAVLSKDIASTHAKLDGAENEPKATLPLQEIVRRVYILESSGGKNVLCPIGKFNGYGYRQNKREWICYNSEAEVRRYVADLFEKRLEKMSLDEALCLYNTGKKLLSCEYVNKFNLIK